MPDEIPQKLTHVMSVDDQKWIPGNGAKPADFMLIGEKPSPEDETLNTLFTGPQGVVIMNNLKNAKIDIQRGYYTNAIKYIPRGKKSVDRSDTTACKPCLDNEIAEVKPKHIICLGSTAFRMVVGNKYKFSEYRGTVVPHPKIPDTYVFTTYAPNYILHNPESARTYQQDWIEIGKLLSGNYDARDITEFEVLTTPDQLREFKTKLFRDYPSPIISLDMEWDGITWMDPNRYIRTIQLGYTVGKCVILELTDVGGKIVAQDMPELFGELKGLLEDSRVAIVGQNVVSDGEWLLSFGIDIRKNVKFDTMLAEHLLNETGPFGLEELTTKYTNMGRYESELMAWKTANTELCRTGYGNIPRDILLPYGAKDVDTVLRIMLRQINIPEFADYQVPRGNYPSLWQTVLDTQRNIYELELTGMQVDTTLLVSMTSAYQTKLQEIEAQLRIMAQQQGFDQFNFRSVDHVRRILFEILKLRPVKTTSGKTWDIQLLDQTMAKQLSVSPSTDKITLEILEDQHPFANMLLKARRLDAVCRYFLRDDDEGEFTVAETGGGIKAKIWPDGRIHTHFSQLSDTGRFRHSKPNSANWPKKAEGFMEDIFGKGNVPPLIRTIITPTKDCLIVEADFSQAELFVLAALSNDITMWDALTTPGKDLHDLTAISAFSITVKNPDGSAVNEQFMLDLAKRNKKEFEKIQKSLVYVKLDGTVLTREAFKSTLRISAKNLEIIGIIAQQCAIANTAKSENTLPETGRVNAELGTT